MAWTFCQTDSSRGTIAHMALSWPLALAIITAPPDAPLPAIQLWHLAPVIRREALRLEILDPREAKQTLANPAMFGSDVRMLRDRYRDFQDAPPIADCMMFPERALTNQLLDFNAKYQGHLEACRQTDPANEMALYYALEETKRLWRIWDDIADVRHEAYWICTRRRALQRLRDIHLGHADYYAGRLPPHVPVQFFRRFP